MSQWEQTSGFLLVSGWLGVTTPVREIYDEIAGRGWTVEKVAVKDGEFVAEAKNEWGESLTAKGRDDKSAAAQLLMRVMRREHMRSAAQRKVGAWKTNWNDQLGEIAAAYAQAPLYDPKAAGAWKALADDCMRRLEVIQDHLHIEHTDDPVPYTSLGEMADDVLKKKQIVISRQNLEHPVWSSREMLAFRTCHDVLGHCVGGGDFGWVGQNAATAAHMPLLTPAAQRALFTETIGRTAFHNYYRTYGPTKIAFLDEHVDPAQASENPPGFQGIHPSQTLLPHPPPSVEPRGDKTAAYHPEAIPQDPNYAWESDAAPLSQEIKFPDGTTKEVSSDMRFHKVPHPEFPNDPKKRLDPLDYEGAMREVDGMHTGWWDFKKPDGSDDREAMKGVIINALRGAMLSRKNPLKANSYQFQHLLRVPHHVDDPVQFWEALNGARLAWNRARGHDDESHKPWNHPKKQGEAHKKVKEQRGTGVSDLRLWQKIERWYNPEMSPTEIDALIKSDMVMMRADATDMARLKPGFVDLPEFKQHHEIDKLLGLMVESLVTDMKSQWDFHMEDPDFTKAIDKRNPKAPKPKRASMEHVAYGDIVPPEDLVPSHPEKYAGFFVDDMFALSALAPHADELLDAALADVRQHSAAGWHFRAAVTVLASRENVKGIGAKVASFAWLLLCPKTSELATIDTHMLDTLGYKKGEINDRDYYRFEREFKAARDASGYSHVPLGSFQWMVWDAKRNGVGLHQDHTPLRPYNPEPWHGIQWNKVEKSSRDKDTWLSEHAPLFWQVARTASHPIAAQWQQEIASKYPKSRIPWGVSGAETPVTPVTSSVGRRPFIITDQGHHHGAPGTTLAHHLKETLGVNSITDLWTQNLQVGKQ